MGKKKHRNVIKSKSLNNKKSNEIIDKPISPNIIFNNEIKKHTPIGLINNGNTCYFNATIQVLACTRRYLPIHLSTQLIYGNIYNNFIQLLITMKENNKCTNPNKLLTIISSKNKQFKGNRQQDAHELFLILLDLLDNEYIKYMKDNGINNHMDDLINTNTDNSKSNQIDSPVINHLDNEVDDKIDNKTDSLTENLIDSHVDNQIESNLNDLIDNNIPLHIQFSNEILVDSLIERDNKPVSRGLIKQHFNKSFYNEINVSNLKIVDDYMDHPSEEQIDKLVEEKKTDIIEDDNYQVENEVDDIFNRIDNQLESQLDNQLDQLDNQIDNQVENTIENQLDNQVDNQLENQFDNHIDNHADEHTDKQEESKSSHKSITKYYTGSLNSVIKCLECNKESITHENYYTISLSIPLTKSQTSQPISLYDCIANYIQYEYLYVNQSNGYQCTHCNQLTNAMKRVIPSNKLPRCLTIHFKRLLYNNKINLFISFPIDLDLNDYIEKTHYDHKHHHRRRSHTSSNHTRRHSASHIDEHLVDQLDNQENIKSDKPSDHEFNNQIENPIESTKKYNYTLVSVIVHQGSHIGGHYVCYALYQSQWYYISDSNVSKCNQSDVLKSNAYMLFYIKN